MDVLIVLQLSELRTATLRSNRQSFEGLRTAIHTGFVEKRVRYFDRLTIGTGAPLLMCSYLMAPTSTTHSSKTAGAGGIGLWADPLPVPPWEWRKRK
jgi:hypothetical protein